MKQEGSIDWLYVVGTEGVGSALILPSVKVFSFICGKNLLRYGGVSPGPSSSLSVSSTLRLEDVQRKLSDSSPNALQVYSTPVPAQPIPRPI